MEAILDRNSPHAQSATQRYAKVIEASRRVRWEIDRDLIRGRRFDMDKKFLPDSLSCVAQLGFLSEAEKRLVSQIQGRTYANVFGLVERFIGAKALELSRDHWMGDQTALEAIVRMTDEELKHQELFRRLERIANEQMPSGYQFLADPNEVAQVVLGKSTWAVLGLTLDIELFTQIHYRASIEPDKDLSELWKDVFLFHWKEESQHAILDEIEWLRVDAGLDDTERDQALDDLIALVAAVDGIVMAQADTDAAYFIRCAGRPFDPEQQAALVNVFQIAYRRQYIVSGVREGRFGEVLMKLLTPIQMGRVQSALEPIIAHAC